MDVSHTDLFLFLRLVPWPYLVHSGPQVGRGQGMVARLDVSRQPLLIVLPSGEQEGGGPNYTKTWGLHHSPF